MLMKTVISSAVKHVNENLKIIKRFRKNTEPYHQIVILGVKPRVSKGSVFSKNFENGSDLI